MNGQELMDFEDRMEEIKESIQKRYPEVKWPDPIIEPVFFGRLKKTAIPARNAILDGNTGKVWDIISDDYCMIPHEKVLYDVLNGLPEEMGTPEVKVRLWADGARFKANIMFPEIKMDTEIKKGDMVRPRISVSSSYDRSLVQDIQMGAEQLVCTNGLVMFKANAKSARRHIAGARVTPEMMAKLAENFIEEYSISTDQWRKWADTKISKLEFDEAMEALPFSEAEREKIRFMPLMNNDGKYLSGMETITLWDINSAATQFAKHEVRGEQRSIELEETIAKIMVNIEGKF